MKFLFKLLLKAGITLGVMFVGYQYILGGGGALKIPGMADMTDSASKGITEMGNAVVDQDVTVYQWKDDKGVTHFGANPPIGQRSYEKKEIQANTNLLNAYKPTDDQDEEIEQKSRVTRVGDIYSPGGAKKLMDDVKNTTKNANEQTAARQKMLDDILGKK